MEHFSLIHHNICLNIVCDNELKFVIKEHFHSSIEILEQPCRKPTYTLIASSKLTQVKGTCYTMVDKWFDYATLDCWIDNSSATCYISNFSANSIENRNLTIQYFVNNLFNRLLELNGYIGIHSSCVEKNSQGIMFIGERLAGKTTCMLTLLDQHYNLVNNDVAAIKYIPDNKSFDAFGITQNIFIRVNKNFLSSPNNNKYLQIANEQNVEYDNEMKLEQNRITLTPFKLAKLNNVKLLPFTILKALIVPKYNSSLNSIKISPLDKKVGIEIFHSQIVPLVHETTDFLKNVSIVNQETCLAEEYISKLTTLPCYLLEYNDHTIDSLSFSLENVLKL